MPIQTTYTDARANLATLCDQVTKDLDVVIITRRGAEDVALVSASELASILETAHLLRSPKNAERLLSALNRAQKGGGKPQTVAKLRKEFGVDE
jgi:antitoxin YefM